MENFLNLLNPVSIEDPLLKYQLEEILPSEVHIVFIVFLPDHVIIGVVLIILLLLLFLILESSLCEQGAYIQDLVQELRRIYSLIWRLVLAKLSFLMLLILCLT